MLRIVSREVEYNRQFLSTGERDCLETCIFGGSDIFEEKMSMPFIFDHVSLQEICVLNFLFVHVVCIIDGVH